MLTKSSNFLQILSIVVLLASFTTQTIQAQEPVNGENEALVLFPFTMSSQQEAHEVKFNEGLEPIGIGSALYDPSDQQLTISLIYANLTENPTAAHFHKAPANEEGDVVQTICGAPEPALLSACPQATMAELTTTWPLSEEQIADLMAGNYFINIHTAMNPDGELRGQLTIDQ